MDGSNAALASRSRGYASMSHGRSRWRRSDVVRLDVLVAGEPVDGLASVAHVSEVSTRARTVAAKLRDALPRQLFKVAVQVAVGGRVIASEHLSAMSKNVLAKCYGGYVVGECGAAACVFSLHARASRWQAMGLVSWNTVGWGVVASRGGGMVGCAPTDRTAWARSAGASVCCLVPSCVWPPQGHHAEEEAAKKAAGGQEAHASARSGGRPASRLLGRATATRLTIGKRERCTLNSWADVVRSLTHENVSAR